MKIAATQLLQLEVMQANASFSDLFNVDTIPVRDNPRHRSEKGTHPA